VAKKNVRLTMFQHPVEVDEDEIPGLRAQGLLVEDEPAAPGSTGDGAPGSDGTAGKPDGDSPQRKPGSKQQ